MDGFLWSLPHRDIGDVAVSCSPKVQSRLEMPQVRAKTNRTNGILVLLMASLETESNYYSTKSLLLRFHSTCDFVGDRKEPVLYLI